MQRGRVAAHRARTGGVELAEMRADLVKEGVDVERLHEKRGEGVGVAQVAHSTHEQYGDSGRPRVLQEAGTERAPVRNRHHQVCDDEVRRVVQGDAEGGLSVMSCQHTKALIFEQIAHHGEDREIIVDDEYRWRFPGTV